MRSIPAEHYSKNQAIAESLHQTSNDVIPDPRDETALRLLDEETKYADS